MRLHLGRNPISVKIIIGTICGNAPTTTQSRSLERYVGLGVRVLAGGWTRRNIFSFDVAEFRFWLNVVVGFIDGKGQRRHTGNVTKAMQIEPFRLVANFAPNKFDA